jgi:hypothetical protein
MSGIGELQTEFWWGNVREEDHLRDPGVEGDNIKIDLREVDWISLRLGTGDGLV